MATQLLWLKYVTDQTLLEGCHDEIQKCVIFVLQVMKERWNYFRRF